MVCGVRLAPLPPLKIHRDLPRRRAEERLAMMTVTRRRILFLASDPSDSARLRLGEERREIQEKLQLARLRNKFEFSSRNAVRISDLTQAILDIEPNILHFSGHGTIHGGLCFENSEGSSQVAQPEALFDLFNLVSDKLECVVLNA